jgi:transposase
MKRPELAGSSTITEKTPERSPADPLAARPAPGDAASGVGIALPEAATLMRMSKLEMVELLYLFEQTLKSFVQRVHHLEGMLAKNSRNSSKPPSSDGLARKPKPAPTLDDAVKRKPGGQPGHEGHALERVANPDEVLRHAIPAACDCGLPLVPLLQESRQVFDLPRPAMRVVEHQIFSASCSCGKTHRSLFPQGVTAPTQYGANIQALGVYLTHHHMLPIARCADILTDLSGSPVSAATVGGMGEAAATALIPQVELIKEQVQAAAVVCADETGMRLGGGLSWLHVAVTEMLTWMGIHKNRGSVAMEEFGILSALTGTLVHDGFSPYRAYDCKHALCNAHHLRELTYIDEHFAQPWAKDMIDFLLQANKEVKAAAGQELSASRQDELRNQYNTIVSRGNAVNPLQPASGKRGRTAQSFPVNLLRRLSDYADDVLRFTQDPAVPFTNNLGERTMRMLKVKQKVSGCFRTLQGARNFCSTRSYLATLAKQGRDLLGALVLTMQGHPPDPRPC